MKIFKNRTKEDRVLQTLKEFTLEGWHNCKRDTPVEFNAFWNYRDERSYEDGMLHKMKRIIVPKELRSKILKHIHKSNQDMEKRSCVLVSNER